MDAFTTVLSVFSTVCAIVFGYIAFVRNRDKDKESDVKHDATVLTEIGYIKGEHGRNQGGAEGTAKDEYGVRNALDRR